MKYAELQRRLTDAGFDPGALLSWSVDSDIDRVQYNIVQQDGMFAVVSAGDRGGYFFRVGHDRKPLLFGTEDDVCDFIWSDVNNPAYRPSKVEPRTSEEIERGQRDAEERYLRKLEEYNKQHGIG